jgi:hypothetical protein
VRHGGAARFVRHLGSGLLQPEAIRALREARRRLIRWRPSGWRLPRRCASSIRRAPHSAEPSHPRGLAAPVNAALAAARAVRIRPGARWPTSLSRRGGQSAAPASAPRRVLRRPQVGGPRWDIESLSQRDPLDERNISPVTLLELYLAMCLCTITVIILMAMKFRESHGMRSATTLCLSGLAGAVRPLLAFAALQTGGVLVLAQGLHKFRRHPKGRALPAVEAPVAAGSTGLAEALDLTA